MTGRSLPGSENYQSSLLRRSFERHQEILHRELPSDLLVRPYLNSENTTRNPNPRKYLDNKEKLR